MYAENCDSIFNQIQVSIIKQNVSCKSKLLLNIIIFGIYQNEVCTGLVSVEGRDHENFSYIYGYHNHHFGPCLPEVYVVNRGRSGLLRVLNISTDCISD